jgi:hypothetical protein
MAHRCNAGFLQAKVRNKRIKAVMDGLISLISLFAQQARAHFDAQLVRATPLSVTRPSRRGCITRISVHASHEVTNAIRKRTAREPTVEEHDDHYGCNDGPMTDRRGAKTLTTEPKRVLPLTSWRAELVFPRKTAVCYIVTSFYQKRANE